MIHTSEIKYKRLRLIRKPLFHSRLLYYTHVPRVAITRKLLYS